MFDLSYPKLPPQSRSDKYILENIGASRTSTTLASAYNAYLDSPSLKNLLNISNYHGFDPDLLYLKQLHESKPENQKISAEDFKNNYADSGLEYDPNFTIAIIESILDKRRKMDINNYIMEHGKADLLDSAGKLAGSIIGGNVAPTNLAINLVTGFVPIGAVARGTWWAANPVKAQMAKFAIGGGIGQGALEPLIKRERNLEQREYGIVDSIENIAESAAFSAVLPVIGYGLKSGLHFSRGKYNQFRNRYFASPRALAPEYTTKQPSLDKQFKHELDDLALNTHPENIEVPVSSYQELNNIRKNVRKEGIEKLPEFFSKEDRIASLEESLHREFATDDDITLLPEHLQKILASYKKALQSLYKQYVNNSEFVKINESLDNLNDQIQKKLQSDQQLHAGYNLDQVDLAIARAQLEDSKYIDLDDPKNVRSIFDESILDKNINHEQNAQYKAQESAKQIKELEKIAQTLPEYEQVQIELESLTEGLTVEEFDLVKRNKLMDLIRFNNAKQFIAANKSIKAGFREFLKQTDMRGKVISSELGNGLMHDLIKSNNLDFFRNKNFEKDIAQELWNITHPNKVPTNSKIAKDIAAIIHKWQSLAINRINNAGASIKPIDGYITRQSHNAQRIKQDGYKKWHDFIIPLLDIEQLDPDIDFKQIWKNLKNGKHLYQNNEYHPHFRHSNITDYFSKARKLHFKSASAWLKYNNVYGTHSLSHSIAINLEKIGKNIGLLENLGAEPYNMLSRLKNDFATKLDSLETTAVADAHVQKELQFVTSNDADHFLEFIIGITPDNPKWAANLQAYRNVINMANLGKVALNSIPDISTFIAEQMHNGISEFKAMSNLFRAVTHSLSSYEKKEFARLLAIGTDNLMGLAYSRLNVDNAVAGRITTATNYYFKLNLMDWWDDSFKSALGLVLSNHLANNVKKPYSKASIELKNNLARYGIDGKDWKILKTFIKKTADGREYIIPPIWDKSANQINEVATKFRTYLKDRVDTGIATPHAAERYAGTLWGTKKGSLIGEVIRFLMQFKQFPLTYMMRGMQDYKGSPRILGTMIGLSVMGGYISIASNRLLNGEEIPELNNNILMAASLKGGGLGFYGDFIFGQHNRYGHSFSESFSGPTVAHINDIAAIYSYVREGNIDSASKKAQQLFKRHLPLRNLFYLQPALHSSGISKEWIDRNLNAKNVK